MADKIVVLNAGRIEQVGSPLELYRRPANTFVAGFIGSPKMNLISDGEAAKLGAKTVGIRPEHLNISGTSGTWKGRVGVAEHLGSDTFLHVLTDNGAMTVRSQGHVEFTHGDDIWLSPQTEHLHRFGADGKRVE